MATLAFVKLQGLGNDFIVAEGPQLPAGLDRHALARRLCDRHFGIGADGLILRWPAAGADARMQIINADGSEPEMCGNGLRCLVHYLEPAGPASLRLETGAGLLRADVLANGAIRVDMGAPRLEADQIPAEGFGTGRVIAAPLECEGQTFEVTLVSMGNPHCVIRVDDLENCGFERWGPLLERHPAFPARINVEFVQVTGPQSAHVKVWERGAGPTLACGTGACAVLVAGVLNGWLGPAAEIELPGGSLQIAWPEPQGPVWMEGPARTVFRGEIELEEHHG